MSNNIFKVYHSKINCGYVNVPNKRMENYELVAEVIVSKREIVNTNLEIVFALTNHIDFDWWENEGVKLVGAKNKRSTSVGDLIEYNGTWWYCDLVGWVRNSVPTE